MAGPKETFYDENIFPLMDEVIRMCKEQDISMLASFELDVEEGNAPDDPMLCSTQLIWPDCKSRKLRKAADIIYPDDPVCLGEMIQTMPDGTKRVTITRL